MSFVMNQRAFEGMLRENIAWLDKQPVTHEQVHIRQILMTCVPLYYPPDGTITLTADEFARTKECAEKYHELLFAVARCFPDETRHETALRYIREAEKASTTGIPCTEARRG